MENRIIEHIKLFNPNGEITESFDIKDIDNLTIGFNDKIAELSNKLAELQAKYDELIAKLGYDEPDPSGDNGSNNGSNNG